MSNYQEQSLDENAVVRPLSESSPGFLHCEKERQAVERLIIEGPEAFYNFIDVKESSGCFLSPAEVSQINSWAEDYRFSQLEVQRQENGGIGSSETEDFCSTYFPSCSDTPAPALELGWPEKSFWMPNGSITVHTSPPAENRPPVREIIRWHLQKATKVIAIVTDKLTDSAIISDLHSAASRGVAVYIILNQRSVQENFTLSRLRHPLIRVRVLGGKTFCSRTGRMVVGEMKDKFLLVDSETVIHGSYSLSWSDAHLHRQLITVLTGLVVESFDTEFRILYAASLPVPATCTVARSPVAVTHQLKERPNLRIPNQKLPLQPEKISSPPPPPADIVLDWEAMGVFQSNQYVPDSSPDQQEDIVAEETQPQSNMQFDKNTPIMDGLTDNGNQYVDKKRVEDIIQKIISRQHSKEENTKLNDKTTTALGDKAPEQTDKELKVAPTQRQEHSNREPIVEEEYTNETSSKVENKPTSRKPLILRVPQSESFSSLNDIMRRLKSRQNPSGQLNSESKATASELSRSMTDLSVDTTDRNDVPPPRFKAGGYDPDDMTAGLALMKRRNDVFKPLLYRTPKNVLPRERPRSSSYALGIDWRKSLDFGDI
ncbi:uncharacterized protein fam83e [Pagrus major]|uniref:uncharacterized protein fam83e n=1 Tax=Pagrus major TaxID=143350 RepID=UPI003CC8A6DD